MKNYRLIVMMICVVLLTTGVLYGQEKEINFDNNKVLSLLPKGTGFVLMIDMKRIIDSSLYKQIMKKEEIQQKYQAYKESSGIDLQKDVDRIVFFVAEETDESPNCSIFIYIGRLDKDKIISAKTNKAISLKEETYHGEKIYCFGTQEEVTKEKPEVSETFFYEEKQADIPSMKRKPALYHKVWVFLNDLAAISDFTNDEIIYLKRFINSYHGEKESMENNQDFIELIKEADQSKMVWGVGFFPEFFKDQANNIPMSEEFDSINSIINSIILFANADKELEFSIKFKCTNEKNAMRLADIIKGYIALSKMYSKENQKLLNMLNEIMVEEKGNAVTIFSRIYLDSMLWLVEEIQNMID
jgi:hypothetical protein